MTPATDIDLNLKELGEFYTRYFSYYNTLEEPYKQLFVARCLQFIEEKAIVGKDDFNPGNRIKALIAASAVQLTLGLEIWNLSYFEEIELHPSDFPDATGNLRFSGETNLQGHIKLSWKSFIRGYEISDDNLNLGLHEFSHALRFNGIRGNDQDYFIDNYFNKWLACAYSAFYDIKNGGKGKAPAVFRKYGGTNINEFLSVCIEHYFESPEEIKENYPLLYYATGILLNQEPGRTTTKIGIRNSFLSEQNKLFPGFVTQNMQSHFLKHWAFKVWAFVFVMLVYSSLAGNILNPITGALFLMFVSIYVWYDYNAVKITVAEKEIHFEKGSVLFKKRKNWTVLLSQLISVRAGEEEWIFTFYKTADDFFYEESVTPPKGVSDAFLNDCRQNKIAVLK